MEIREDHLLARCRAGDLDAFGQIYAHYGPQVFRHAYCLLEHHEEASDITQETFVRAYQALGGFRGDCGLQTWLLRICGNLCRDRLKSWRYRREVLCDPQATPDLFDHADGQPDPALVVERAQTTQIILCALRELPPAQREILLLREVEEMSIEEIAVVLDCSRASVRVRLFRARHLLKERVAALLAAKS